MSDNFMGFDIETIADPDFPEDLAPEPKLGNVKDPVKVAAAKAEKTAKEVENRPLVPWQNRIICIGFMVPGHTKVWATDEESETEIVEQFWSMWPSFSPHIGFNCNHFDLPSLIVASYRCGIVPPPLNLSPYHGDAVDLADLLCFHGKEDFQKQTWYAKRLGIPVPDDYEAGKQVAEWYAAKDWAKIRTHCAEDVKLTHALAIRLGVL